MLFRLIVALIWFTILFIWAFYRYSDMAEERAIRKLEEELDS